MALIVEIAGIDGSGKTTLIQRLINIPKDSGLQVELASSAPPREAWFMRASAELSATGSCSIPLADMCSAALRARRETVQQLRNAQGLFALDRHGVSLLGFYSYLGLRGVESLGREFRDILPDRLVFLDESPEVCHGRLAGRGGRLDSHERELASLRTHRACLLNVVSFASVPTLTLAGGEYPVDAVAAWLFDSYPKD